MRMPLAQCKKRLAMLWLGCSGTLVALLMAQSLANKWRGSVQGVWDWLLPNVLPTTMLIVGALVIDLRTTEGKEETVDPFLYRLALSLSLFHLAAVAVSLLAAALRDDAGLLQTSRLWLAATQSLASAALGAFFVSRRS